MPANVALLHVLMQSPSLAAAEAAIRTAQTRASGAGAQRIGAALELLQTHPAAFDLVRDVLGSVDHDARASTPDETLATLAQAFDRAATRSPGGGSALYALGDDSLLARATHEVVEAIARWGLIGRERRMVEVGCGSGRFLEALAPLISVAVGLEISAVMARQAHLRIATHANAAVVVCDGRSLGLIADRSVDLVIYADSFPYLVQAGAELAGRHVAESARVLKCGGRLLILNLSYRDDVELDFAELQAWAAAAGMGAVTMRLDAFRLWDAASFTVER